MSFGLLLSHWQAYNILFFYTQYFPGKSTSHLDLVKPIFFVLICEYYALQINHRQSAHCKMKETPGMKMDINTKV